MTGAMLLNAKLWEMVECSRGGGSGWSGHLQLLKHQSDLLQTKVNAVMEALRSASAGAVVSSREGVKAPPQSCGKGCLLH